MTHGDVRAAIDTGNQQFMTNFSRKDAAGMASLYTSNGSVLPANADILSGTANVAAFWQGAFDMGLEEAVLETIELEAHGDTAIETGHYTLKAGGAVADHGKYIVIWKNDGGTWKLHKDIWNTSQPAG